MSLEAPEMPGITRSTSKSAHLSTPIHMPHHVISPSHKRWHSRPSSFILAAIFIAAFALAAAEVGLSSFLLHHYGNDVARWSNLVMLKHLVGLTLFNGICTLLLALGSYYIPPMLAIVLLFANSVIWIVDAGLLHRASPMRAGDCERGASFTRSFRVNCDRIVAMDALAWTIWALLFLAMAFLLHRTVVGLRRKDNRHTLYGV